MSEEVKKKKEHVYNPVKDLKGDEAAKAVIWSTKSINIALDAIKKGLPLNASPFLNGNTKLLKPELVYKRTEEEIEDYVHCMTDILYFASKCYITQPTGLEPCVLRDYQVEYLKLLQENRFNIFLSCRLSGKCFFYLATVKIKANFIDNKIEKIKLYYIGNNTYELPFYELYNLYCEQTFVWRLKYHLYKYCSNNISYYIISLLDKIYDQEDKIVEEYPVEGILILTDTGYKNLSRLYMTKPFEKYSIKLENGYYLDCADTHIVFDLRLNEVFVKDLNIGDYVSTDKGPSKVIYKYHSNLKVCMADLTVDDINHRFYSNGILSHNSVTTAIFGLWFALFQTDINGLILSKSGPAGVDLLGKIKDMFLNLPYHLKPGVTKWNQHEIAFDSNSTLHTEAFSDTAGLGQTINFLILDEFAWTPPSLNELFYQNVIPTVTTMPNSRVCIMSTLNGFNLFYKLWIASIKGKSAYKHFKVDWDRVPNWDPETKTWVKRDEKWKEMMIGVLGSESAFYYQYGTMFLASDYCLVSKPKMLDIHRDEVQFIQHLDMDYPNFVPYLFWHPDFDLELLKTEHFIILCDLAEGGGSDYTIFNFIQVLGKDKFKQIGYWRCNTLLIESAALNFWLLYACLFENSERCLISIEWNTYGALFYRILMNLNENDEFPETLFRFNYAFEGIELGNCILYNKNMMEIQVDGNTTRKTIPGIRFSGANKVTACSMLKMYIENSSIIIQDLETITELENFEDKTGSGSYKASFGHDDLIMTFCQIPMLMQTPQYDEFIEEMTANDMVLQYNNMNPQTNSWW